MELSNQTSIESIFFSHEFFFELGKIIIAKAKPKKKLNKNSIKFTQTKLNPIAAAKNKNKTTE